MLLLLLLSSVNCGVAALSTCHWCNTAEGWPESDPACGNDGYVGFNQTSDWGACTIYIYDNGRVVRTGSHNIHTDGECHDYDAYRTCHCFDDLCNNRLCQACDGITTDEITTPTPVPTTTEESGANQTCHWCDTMEGWPESDPACGNDGYIGLSKTDDTWAACTTYIYDTGRVYRSGSISNHEDGECYKNDLYQRCHCLDDLCNNRLCQACDGIATEELTTPEPTTTVDPGLTCYNCDTDPGFPESDPDCGMDGYGGLSETRDTWNSCITYTYDSGRVWRTGKKGVHDEGDCEDKGSYEVCYCTTDSCNNGLCQDC